MESYIHSYQVGLVVGALSCSIIYEYMRLHGYIQAFQSLRCSPIDMDHTYLHSWLYIHKRISAEHGRHAENLQVHK